MFHRQNFMFLNQRHEVVVVFLHTHRLTNIPVQEGSWDHRKWRLDLQCTVFNTNKSEYSPRIIGLTAPSFGSTSPTLPYGENGLQATPISKHRPRPPCPAQFCRLRLHPGLQPRGERSSLHLVWERGYLDSDLERK